jgi:hypothetical protein
VLRWRGAQPSTSTQGKRTLTKPLRPPKLTLRFAGDTTPVTENGAPGGSGSRGKVAIATSKKVLSPSAVSKLAAAEYLRDEANPAVSFPYSPARATAVIGRRKDSPETGLIGIVAEVYYRENGTRSPLVFPRGKATPAGIASAVAKRRKAGGRLGRWDVIAYSLGAALGEPGRKVSLPAVRRYAENGGVSLDSSYTGRGTRKGAPATRSDATAEENERAS